VGALTRAMLFQGGRVSVACTGATILLVARQPLSDGVVRHPVPTTRARVAERGDVADQLRMRWTDCLAKLRSSASVASVAAAAVARAVPLRTMTGPKFKAAAKAGAPFGLEAVLATAVSIKRRRAVRTHDPQVRQAVIVSHTVDVVEDQGHPPTHPYLALTAKLAFTRLQPLLEQALLEVPARVARTSRQNETQGNGVSSQRFVTSPVRIEVVDGYEPNVLDVSPQGSMVTPRWAHAQPPQRL